MFFYYFKQAAVQTFDCIGQIKKRINIPDVLHSAPLDKIACESMIVDFNAVGESTIHIGEPSQRKILYTNQKF